MSEQFSSVELSQGWTFKQSDEVTENTWLSVKSVPSTVHRDLIDNNKIPHPFVGFNEIEAEWVGTKSWTYRTSFSNPQAATNAKVALGFDGLDTFACVKLDGKVILYSDNMFLPSRVDITEAIAEARLEHELEITFEPAFLKAKEIQNQYPKHKFICFNGDSSRLCVRKAQYQWGWDWGPLLMCCGIWRPIHLETFVARISDFRADIGLDRNYETATVHASITTEGHGNTQMFAHFSISLDGKLITSAQVVVSQNGQASTRLLVETPQLWMPSGYGKQPLYDINVVLRDERGELHSRSLRLGMRTVELVQDSDKHGKSFYFRVNGVDIFSGGSCWIPADSFLPELTSERYRAWLELIVLGNQSMIRVWGGGIYESDMFYDLCDELGILVWQDFMFACGNYPTSPEILESIEAEAVANVRRLRHHPSVILFAGNNEDYQVQEQAGLTYDYNDRDERNWLTTDFPARYIYESLLPRVMASEAPKIPYHPGSPWGDGRATSDPTVGDLHQWGVWHGAQYKYQIYDTLGGRFNSEFGIEAFPHIATIKSFVENEEDLYAQSHVIDFHNKADGHERRIATYLVENVWAAAPDDLETHIYLTQLIQSEALKFGYRGWRKQWGDDRYCGGALVWQFNDCWPVTSWSIVDYYLRRKPAYYSMARVLAPFALGIRREHHDWSVTHAQEPRMQKWELWAVSALESAVVDIEVRFLSVKSGRAIRDPILKKAVPIPGNGTTDIMTGCVNNVEEEPHVLAARMWLNGKIVARDTDWPQPFKYLSFPGRGLRVQAQKGGKEMYITAERPVKCLVFEERKGCYLSDSAIDVLPGDPQIIIMKGLKQGDSALSWKYLGMGEQ